MRKYLRCTSIASIAVLVVLMAGSVGFTPAISPGSGIERPRVGLPSSLDTSETEDALADAIDELTNLDGNDVLDATASASGSSAFARSGDGEKDGHGS